MSVLSVVKLLLTEDIKNKINDKINEIGDCSDLSQFDVGIVLDNLDVSSLKYEEILLERDRAKFIAKVSLDLWNDFEHYRQFRLKSLDETDEVKERLTNLGYECKNHSWESILRPKICDVQTNILLYCFCESIFIKMKYNDENLQNIKNEELEKNFIKDDGVNVEKRSVPFVMDLILSKNDRISDQQPIQCTFSDYYNREDKTLCDISDGELKKQRPDYDGQIKNVWLCSVCTFINKSVNKRCEACGKKEVCEGRSKDGNEENIKSINKNKNIKNKSNHFNLQNLTYENQDNVTQNYKADIALKNNERFDKGVLENTSLKNTTKVEYVSDVSSEKRGLRIDNNNVSESRDIWDCPSCTFKNKLEDKCCEVCFTIREVEIPSAKEDMRKGDAETAGVIEGRWMCMHCKKDNSFDRYTCGSCREYAPFFNKWVCEKCSFFNDEMCLYCEVCNVKNVHLKMCKKCKKVIKVEDGGLCYDCGDSRIGSKESLVGNDWNTVKGKKNAKDKPNNKGDNIPNLCMDNKYYCNNRWCGTINNSKSEHCSKCKLKKEAKITIINAVDVFNGNTYVKMRQCNVCGYFNTNRTCGNCKNRRDSLSYKRCSQCNWFNKVIDKKCDKCFKEL